MKMEFSKLVWITILIVKVCRIAGNAENSSKKTGCQRPDPSFYDEVYAMVGFY